MFVVYYEIVVVSTQVIVKLKSSLILSLFLLILVKCCLLHKKGIYTWEKPKYIKWSGLYLMLGKIEAIIEMESHT